MKNTKAGYGWVAIALHWLMTAALFFLFGLGLYMVELTYYDAWYRGSFDLHKSIGMLLLLAAVGRFVWRLINPLPMPLGSPLEQKAAHFMHRILYLVMVTLMLSGYLISTADGRSIAVFGLFEMPALPLAMENQEDIAGTVHWGLAWTLIGLAAIHALAAIKHHYIDKDGTLKRMLLPHH